MSPMTPHILRTTTIRAALGSALRRLDAWTLSTLNAPTLTLTTRNR
jgi:hypothetical protein